jgi:low temperature requirement protein LtrA
MWWIYFDTGHERGSHHIASSADPGRVARLAYTYMHLPIVAGIIVTAVGDELVLAHPTGHTEPKAIAVMLGGPALYLLGNLLFKRVIAGRLPLSHLVGMGLLALLAPAAPSLSPLLLATAATVALIVVAVWEMIALRRGAPATHPV